MEAVCSVAIGRQWKVRGGMDFMKAALSWETVD